MSNSDTALREFSLIMANMRAEACFMGDYEINQLANEIEGRLTALISEHYYPKDFVEWFHDYYGKQKSLEIDNQPRKYKVVGNIYKTLDELYEYWKENVR